MERVGVLVNIRSAHNTGAMFRSADGAGFSKLFLVGITPTPKDRFGRERRDIAKTALGAQKSIDWKHFGSISEVLSELKRDGFFTVAVEQSKNSKDFETLRNMRKKKIALFVGSETEGIPEEVLQQVDMVVEIPMRGIKNSLNVACAFSIVAYTVKDEI